jgi:hypothetical protein
MGFLGFGRDKKAAAMNPEERLGKTLFTGKETGTWLLNKIGTVVPFGVSFPADGLNPATFFPRDEHPEAEFSELLDFVVAEMRARVRSGAASVAMVTELHSDDGSRAMLVDAEDREQGRVRFMYAIEKSAGGCRLTGEEAIDGSPFVTAFSDA